MTSQSKVHFSGKVIGATYVKNDEGMAVKFTLDGGVYLEVTALKDTQIFNQLRRLAELDAVVKVTVERG